MTVITDDTQGVNWNSIIETLNQVNWNSLKELSEVNWNSLVATLEDSEKCGTDCSSLTYAEKNIVLFTLLVLLGIIFVVNNPHGRG